MAKLPANLRFLVTAGPTREFLDPVRFLSNRSSGRMGYALAAAARQLSPHVTLVSGPTSLTPPANLEFVPVVSAAEMADAVFARFAAADVVLMAAAVCDYRPAQVATGKLKKQSAALRLDLEPTPDILAELGRRRQRQVLVGFAVETDELETRARDKLQRKNLDLIVGNGVAAFDSATNRVVILGRDGTREALPSMSKEALATLIIERALARVP